jgi:hypothetical protein
MRFQIAGGSVPGTRHTMPGKPGWINNQDAFYWNETDESIIAVVCDGCGSCEHSEIGAHVVARFLIQALSDEVHRYVRQIEGPDIICKIRWNRIKTAVLSQIYVLAAAMEKQSLSRTINDYFLFTIVGAVITSYYTFIFSLGDGVFMVNSQVTKLGPFTNNEPPYIAYNITGSKLTDNHPEFLNFVVEPVIPTSEIFSLVVGSDGLADLISAADICLPHRSNEVIGNISQFWTDDSFFDNPDNIRRRLAIINKEGARAISCTTAVITSGPLPDDTTLIVIRRHHNEEGGAQ